MPPGTRTFGVLSRLPLTVEAVMEVSGTRMPEPFPEEEQPEKRAVRQTADTGSSIPKGSRCFPDILFFTQQQLQDISLYIRNIDIQGALVHRKCSGAVGFA